MSRVEDALRLALQRLSPVADRPQVEAQVLLAHVLKQPRTFVMAHPEVELSPEQEDRFSTLLARRQKHEPLPYLTGRVEFFGLEIAVTPAVLIPRPETELLVETVLEWLQHPVAPVAVDVGTGSGCLVVALAARAPHARYYATDLSTAALTVARSNARHHRVEDSITFLAGDLLSSLPERVDLIVSNPPYVAENEWDALPLSVKQEPRHALVSGADGLDVIRRLLEQAPQMLRPGGRLLCEIGERQGDAVQALAQAAFPRAEVHILPDLAGKPRMLQIVQV